MLSDDELMAKREEAIAEWRRIKTVDFFADLFGEDVLAGTKYAKGIRSEITRLNTEAKARRILLE